MGIKQSPLFSIVIPCYQQGHYLRKCLGSIQGQSFGHWEAIIVNDGSTDSTQAVAKEFLVGDDRIRYIWQANQGLSSARNVGVDAAKSEWIIFLDSDDWLLPQYLERLAESVSDDVDMVQVGYRYYEDNEQTVLADAHGWAIEGEPLLPELIRSNLGPVHSFTVRRSCLIRANGFDCSLKSAEDWDLWIRLAKCGLRYRKLPDVLVAYRLVGSSMSHNAERMYKNMKSVVMRSVRYDERLSGDCPGNRDYQEIDVCAVMQRQLAFCLGVYLSQMNVEKAVELFKLESASFNCTWKPRDFTPMCSYLTFRYRSSPEHLQWIQRDLIPEFGYFFSRVGFGGRTWKLCMYMVFRNYYMVRNNQKFGIAGKLINLTINLLFLGSSDRNYIFL